MKEKRSPHGAIHSERTSRSLLIAGLLILAAVAAIMTVTLLERAALLARQDTLETSLQMATVSRQKWVKKYGVIHQMLLDRYDSIQSLKSRLRDSEIRFDGYMRQFTEPIGFIDTTESPEPGLQLYSCTRILKENPQYLDGRDVGATLMSFFFWDRQITENLLNSPEYVLVGMVQWATNWDGRMRGVMYVRKDILEIHPFDWGRGHTWSEARRRFTDYLQRQC